MLEQLEQIAAAGHPVRPCDLISHQDCMLLVDAGLVERARDSFRATAWGRVVARKEREDLREAREACSNRIVSIYDKISDPRGFAYALAHASHP